MKDVGHRFRTVALLAAATATFSGCEGITPEIDWNRMVEQRRIEPQAASPLFADRRAMRPPPEGTVPRDRPAASDPLRSGRSGDGYASALPLALNAAVMARGRDRYELICATCHGILGDGAAVVAHNMELRKPPSLITEPARSLPEGRIFEVISHGYGLMPGYAQELEAADRWAVVAYLRALSLSQGAQLSRLPARVQRTAAEALP